jgi:hypothetical protein
VNVNPVQEYARLRAGASGLSPTGLRALESRSR